MAKKSKKGLSRLISAAGYSIAGIKSAWENEEAFRLELILAIFMVPAALWLGTTVAEQCLLIITCFIVLITELVNSAIEAVVDRLGSEHHPLSGRAKDLGSAAVFISLLLTLIVWGIIAYKHFLMASQIPL